MDSLGGSLDGQLGSYKFGLAESAEILPEKNKNSTVLSMDSWGSPKSLSNHPLI